MSRTRSPWKTALVTGASSGIGEAFARCLAAAGTDLVIVARRETRLRSLAQDLHHQQGVKVEVIVADLTDHQQLLGVEARLDQDEQPIDLLVNNAGGHHRVAGLVEQGRDVLADQMMLNAGAVLRLTHAAAVGMTEKSAGNIIQVSAGVSYYPAPGSATYGASKAFVNSLTEAVNFECRDRGVRVIAVCPGFTRTETPPTLGFTEASIPRFLWQEPEEVVNAALRAARKGRPVLVNPGLINRMGARIGKHLPHRILLPYVSRGSLRGQAHVPDQPERV